MAQDGGRRSQDRGNGFVEHGVAVPVCRARGVAATVDGDGKPVILVWLDDYRGTRGLLMLDITSGRGVTYDVPVPEGDSPFAILLSGRNRFYALFSDHLLEFDPAARAFTFVGKVAGGMAMSLTEDPQGLVWAGTYPDSQVVSFNPETRELVNYGPANRENWPQYPSYVAVDAAGWVYLGIGCTNSQVVAFNPRTREARPLAKEGERKAATGVVFRGVDGVVYGAPDPEGAWYVLSEGKATPTTKPSVARAPIRAGSQETVLAEFPDGRRIQRIRVPEKWVEIREQDGTVRRLTFDYASAGAHVQSLVLGPNGKVYGCAGHPLRLFAYDPAADRFEHHGWREENGHLNALAVQRGRLFGAMYGGGYLFDYDVSAPWNDVAEGPTNPRILADGGTDIGRPHALLAHPDGHTLIMAGTPAYGYTGGGLLFYDLDTGRRELVGHQALIPEQSTIALDALGDGRVLVGGTTIAAGTGGEVRAKEAELYLLDFATHRVTFHAPIVPGAAEIRDLKVGPDGLVYGLATGQILFAFDPAARKVVHQECLTEFGELTGSQAPRTILLGPDGKLYLYLSKAILRLEPSSFGHEVLVRPPVTVGVGIALHQGRLYFMHESRLWSWQVPGLK
jgi:streptogramin lyase